MFTHKVFRKVSLLSKEEHQLKLTNTTELLKSVSNYFQSISSRPVLPISNAPLLPKTLPQRPIEFSKILDLIETCVYPNNLQWQHPMFFAYYPLSTSWETIQGSILAKALGSVCFTKESCPVANDIEMIVSDWLAEMLQLPNQFFHSRGSGGGMTYGTITEAVLTAMACSRIMRPNKQCVAYTSEQSHFLVAKAAKVLGIPIRVLPSFYDPAVKNYPVSIPHLKEQIFKDKKEGLTPAFFSGILGGTNVGANDNLTAVGEITASEDMWFHVDAAYAGPFFVLPEIRPLLNGVEYVTSLSINPGKLIYSGVGHTMMWFKDYRLLADNLKEDGNYLKSKNEADLKDWQIPLGRECKGLNLWMIIQQYGAEGIRDYVRKHVDGAKYMEKLLLEDGRFELVTGRDYGLLVFRVKGEEEKTERLLKRLGQSNEVYILGSDLYGKHIIRFCPFSNYEDFSNIKYAFDVMCSYLD